ncbi:PREDICTED: SUN domain-containing protein 1-like [Ceratosolen solmsi marchali]|uniref:SUN domain-containing protein 1-like n=1 Tax=Ceratosolen solmsi marchali TaxID=326594 RepID=A0AAJ6YEL0_9HYME|nr:PREDICTED: SUN domain-containing protein 1-like [Ceratosolen solmsi marchali]
MKTDLNKLRSNLNILGNNLNSLSNEVKVVMESNSEIENNFKEIKCRLRNLSDTILKLRNEVYEESISLDSVKEIVKSELETYDADKTGKTDFALESSGGSIISTRNTETYFVGVPTMSIFGIPICKQHNIPRIIIQVSFIINIL